MTALDTTETTTRPPFENTGKHSEVPATPPPHPPTGNPAMIGMPTTIAGALGLGLTLTGFVSDNAANSAIPIVMTATSLGLLIATVWAAWLGQNVVATVYAVFMGFYTSYAGLQLGLANDWFGIGDTGATDAVEVYVICWLVVIGMLTFATLRLPLVFTILLGLVDVALAILLVATMQDSTPLTRLAGWVVMAFVAVAIYMYLDLMSQEQGGKPYPTGKPLVES